MGRSRRSGILLHLTSLSSRFGMGDMGPDAYKFADFLNQSKQSLWQVLPLNPVNLACGCSPYSSTSAFAGNTFLISPQILCDQGFILKEDLEDKPDFNEEYCDYKRVFAYKNRIFIKVYRNFKAKSCWQKEYDSFCKEHFSWLDDFSLFEVIKENNNNKPWYYWELELRDRDKKALKDIKIKFAEKIEKEKLLQYIFFKQWLLLKKHCNNKGISIIGDIPIYVSYDSCDAWVNTDIFKINKEKQLTVMAGVPPDYFSQTGQLWGNPVYDWEALKKSGYEWWIKRIRHNLLCFDQIRIDHFRGLVAYWEVPRGSKDATTGKWVKAPVRDFFKTLFKEFPHLPIIAEDLGIVTPDVKKVLKELGLPGMKILLFAFDNDDPEHPYLPHTYDNNWFVYTGTHDNNTVKGWYENEASQAAKNRLHSYLGKKINHGNIHWDLIKLAMSSAADTAIFPLQDILGLGEDARMNRPSVAKGNWQWRFKQEQLSQDVLNKLTEMTRAYGRG